MGDRTLNEGEAISPKAIFDEALPYYLTIGMPYELYWDGRPELVIPYRRADILRQKRSNNDAWLQGVYFMYAVAATLDKKSKYPKVPFDIDENMPAKSGMTIKQERAKAAFAAFAKQFNEKMHSDAKQRGDDVEYANR